MFIFVNFILKQEAKKVIKAYFFLKAFETIYLINFENKVLFYLKYLSYKSTELNIDKFKTVVYD